MRFFAKVFIGICYLLTLTSAAYCLDDFYGDKELVWFDKEVADCFDSDKAEPTETVPLDNALYMTSWKLLNNCLPYVSEFLAPTPYFGERTPISVINRQDYYYDTWANTTIVLDSDNEVALLEGNYHRK